MFKTFSPAHKAILLALTGYTCFSLSDAGVKWLTQHYGIYQILAIENFFSMMTLLVFASKLGGLQSLINADATAEYKTHLIRGFFNTAINIMVVYTFTLLPLASVYTAVFSIPFIATLIAIPLFKERVGAHRWSCIVLGFCGILIAFRPWEAQFPPLLGGALIALPAAISLMFLAARWAPKSSPIALAFWPIAFSFIVNTAIATQHWGPIDLSHLPLLIFCAACVAFGILSLSLAFQQADSSLVSPMIYVQMLWGVIFGAIFFGDLPDPWILSGAAVIIISGIYLVYREKL